MHGQSSLRVYPLRVPPRHHLRRVYRDSGTNERPVPRPLLCRYRDFCVRHRRAERPCERATLERIEAVAATGAAYVWFAHIPVPLHVSRLTATDTESVTFWLHEGCNTVLLRNNGTYYHRGQAVSTPFNFWVHSVIRVSPTPYLRLCV